jgi:protein-tyrosine phosphatase
LPGLDDGAKDWGEALEMARIACADGIGTVVATPHVSPGVYDNNRDCILNAVKGFNQLLSERRVPLRVLPGAEYRLDPDLPEQLAGGELLTVNDGGR